MGRVAIIGAGMTKFGQLWNQGLVELAVEANMKAIEDSGLDRKQIEALYIGNMSSGLFTRQEHISSLIADSSGLAPIPSTRVEAACASGAVSLRQAYLAVKSGMYDAVIAAGVEKMTDVTSTMSTRILSTASSQDYEASIGATFPGLYAMIARMHMHRFSTSEEQLAMVAVKNHRNALNNPYAHLRKSIKVDDVMNSAKVADPIKLLDCAPISDGAAAVVIASEELARKACDTPVWIEASAQASDSISLHNREDLVSLKASAVAGREAFRQARSSIRDIDCLELHDCFTIAEVLALEDLGFVEKGKGGKLVEEGLTEIGAKIPVNPSGGLKAKGHPIGASGIAQAIEATMQLRGDAFNNTNSQRILTHNVGGSGATAVVHIFGR
ncbi:thiolase domain-containing protein [Candidatus Woesearchaeota archaeon]|nr:thiolase domain-containing protein [Candidatus Woesearchaeota archaeon]